MEIGRAVARELARCPGLRKRLEQFGVHDATAAAEDLNAAALARTLAAATDVVSAKSAIEASARAVVGPKLERGMLLVTWLDEGYLKAANSFLRNAGVASWSAAEDVRAEAGVRVGKSIRNGSQYSPGCLNAYIRATVRHTASDYVMDREHHHDSHESLCNGGDRDSAPRAPEPFQALWTDRGSAFDDCAETIFGLETISSERVCLELKRLPSKEREALIDLLSRTEPTPATVRQAQTRGRVRLTLALADEAAASATRQRRLLEAMGSAAATHMTSATRKAWTHVNHASLDQFLSKLNSHKHSDCRTAQRLLAVATDAEDAVAVQLLLTFLEN